MIGLKYIKSLSRDPGFDKILASCVENLHFLVFKFMSEGRR